MLGCTKISIESILQPMVGKALDDFVVRGLNF